MSMTSRKPRPSSRRNDGIARDARPATPLLDDEALDDYLAEIIGELERLARAHRKEMLAYLLSMASVQANGRLMREAQGRVLH